jgi:hypothetical protein
MQNRAPSAPLVISCLALFVALSGTAVAVKSEVGARAKNGKVHTADIAKDAVTGPKVAPGAVDSKDLAFESIQHAHLDVAIVDENNMRNGSVSARTLLPIHIVQSEPELLAPGFHTAHAQCPEGEVLLSGGAQVNASGSSPDQLIASGPDTSIDAPRTWFGQVYVTDVAGSINVWALCLPAST